MDEKKSIGNVNVLDLRKATEASVAQIGKIGNANVVLYTPETSGLIAHLSFGNLNASVEVPAGDQVQMIAGKTAMNKDYFKSKAAPEFLVIVGKLQIHADVSRDDIESKITGMAVVGKVLCPEHLMGILQSKSKMTLGKFAAYPAMKQVRFSDLVLDERALNAMDDHSELAVIGSITIPAVQQDDLLKRKFASLFALDGVTCHAENTAQIQSVLHKDTPEMTIIPAGYEWSDQPIDLDSISLSLNKGRKLFCTEKVQIETEVTAQQLEDGLAGLICKQELFCPGELKESLAKICDLLKTSVVFYSGTLYQVEGKETLYNSFLEALDGNLTIIVDGMLSIDPAIQAKTLAEHLAKIHNHGMISCPPELIGILQLRLGVKDGVIVDSTKSEPDEEPSEFSIGNANYLAL